jgi:hypothetical protein
MGTNYYWYQEKPLPSWWQVGQEQWDADPAYHIGKSSFGWCFSLHVTPDNWVVDLEAWKVLFGLGRIKNEYGDLVSTSEMMTIITERGRPLREWEDDWWAPKPFGAKPDGTPFFLPGYDSEADFHASNHSERGPCGLLRHRIDGVHCIGHGAGTWDLIQGHFR